MNNYFYIQWHITNRCNLRCLHCYQETFEDKGYNWKLLKQVTDNIISTLEKWNRYGVITITGGEPFLKKELFTLIDYLCNSSQIKEVSIITNGFFLKEPQITRLLKNKNKIDNIKLSLDGKDNYINNSIRPNSFDIIVATSNLIKSAGFKATLMFTLLNRNKGDIIEVINLARQIADSIIIERFIPQGRGKNIKEEVVGGEELKRIYQQIFEYCDIAYEEEDLVRYKAFKLDFNEKVDLFGSECMIGVDGLCIMPDGTVYPCRRLPISLGNLLTEKLSDIWNGQLLNNLRHRDNLEGKCRRCSYLFCKGCRAISFALTNNIFSEDITCYTLKGNKL